MSYKTILVQLDQSQPMDGTVAVACKLAEMENAHLIGSTVTGESSILYQVLGLWHLFQAGQPAYLLLALYWLGSMMVLTWLKRNPLHPAIVPLSFHYIRRPSCAP